MARWRIVWREGRPEAGKPELLIKNWQWQPFPFSIHMIEFSESKKKL